jgi:hypothetical protein
VSELRRKGWSARGIDGGRRRWPRRLGGNGEGGAVLGNTRPWEVHWGLVKVLERLVGGERERGCEFTAAAAMADGGARDGALRGEGVAFIGRLALGDDG